MKNQDDSLPELPLEPPDDSIYCGICQQEILEDESYSDYGNQDGYAHKKCEEDQ